MKHLLIWWTRVTNDCDLQHTVIRRERLDEATLLELENFCR